MDTGLVSLLQAHRPGVTNPIQKLSLEWDAVGNLLKRHEEGRGAGTSARNWLETFQYDALNRLTNVNKNINAVLGPNQTMQYNSLGNITHKSGVGAYNYGQNGAGPHAVTSAGSGTFSYDANGNMVADSTGRNFTYSTFDQVTEITKGSTTVSFQYGADRQRYRRVDSHGGESTETLYIGSVEKITKTSGATVTSREWKRHIGGGVLITQTLNAQGQPTSETEHYLLKDHLGSPSLITGNNGVVVQELWFDAWGMRVNVEDDAQGLLNGLLSGLFGGNGGWLGNLLGGGGAVGDVVTELDQLLDSELYALLYGTEHDPNRHTTRGFTGHEMVDLVGIIHMNGRIYDPRLGRFLQADPFIQAASDTQMYNRYSYVRNNPLNAVDPSGYFLKKFFKSFFRVLPTIVAFINPVAGAIMMASMAIMETLAAGGGFFDVIMAGVTSAAFASMGMAEVGAGFVAVMQQSLSFGAVGGILTVMQGGKFGHGFVAAGLGTATSGIMRNTQVGQAIAGNSYSRVFTSAIVGGTGSKLTGGKFKNGAATAAFAAIATESARAMVDRSRQIQEMRSRQTPGINLASGISSGDSAAMSVLNMDIELDFSHYTVYGPPPETALRDLPQSRADSLMFDMDRAYSIGFAPGIDNAYTGIQFSDQQVAWSVAAGSATRLQAQVACAALCVPAAVVVGPASLIGAGQGVALGGITNHALGFPVTSRSIAFDAAFGAVGGPAAIYMSGGSRVGRLAWDSNFYFLSTGAGFAVSD